MTKISIIGAAGTLGAACAMSLLMRDLADELCLIDVNEALLDNHVMDLENAFPRKSIYRGSYEDLRGSKIVVITAGVPNRSDVTSRTAYLHDNLTIFEKIGSEVAKHAPDAIVVTASNPVDILNYYLYKRFGFSRNQLIGYSLNDSHRFEWALRKNVTIDPNLELRSPVIGEHGNSQVPLFSQVTLNGTRIVITEKQKASVNEELRTWFVRFNRLNVPRTTGWTTSVGVSKLVEQLLGEEPTETIGSAILSGEYDLSDISIGVPLRVHSQGIESIPKWSLDEGELTAFQSSAKKIQTIIDENQSYFSY